MKKFLEIMGWTLVLSVTGVIVFVRAGQAGGESGGKQASSIISSAGGTMSKIISSLQGYQQSN